MNQKIYTKLLDIIKTTPDVMINKQSFKVMISGTFGVTIDLNMPMSVAEITDAIDKAVLKRYFSEVWQPKTKKYKYSGLGVIDEVNALKPRSVVDLGCGFNEFKGKIDNLVGIDPYNTKADILCDITRHSPKYKYDIALCFGSINFGGSDKIFNELSHVVNNIVNPGGLIFFRGNPGKMHEAEEARWIDFFEWTPSFIHNSAKALGCIPVIIRPDDDRLYFVWKTGDK